jgi:hypothetical protein
MRSTKAALAETIRLQQRKAPPVFGPRPAPGPGETRDQHDDQRRRILPEQRPRQQHRRAVAREFDMDVVDARGDASGRQKGLRRRPARGREQVLERARSRSLSLQTKQRRGGRVGLQHPMRSCVDDERRLARHLEQEPISLLGVADARVFALHRLSLLHQARLRGRERPEIAAHREHVSPFSQANCGVAHRNVGAIADGMIDLAPPGDATRRRIAEQVRNFGGALGGDDFGEPASYPIAVGGLGEARVGERDVEHVACGAQHKGDVGGAGDNGARAVRV